MEPRNIGERKCGYSCLELEGCRAKLRHQLEAVPLRYRLVHELVALVHYIYIVYELVHYKFLWDMFIVHELIYTIEMLVEHELYTTLALAL